MSPITAWNPATRVSRGNVSVGLAPAVSNINGPSLAELSTGLGLECAITTQNGTSSSDNQTVDWLCKPSSEQLPGSVTHSMDDLVIKASGQDDEDLIAALKQGDVVYLWRRDGVESDDALTADQYVWVWKISITSIDPLEASNAFIGITAHITVLDRSETAVKISA